MGDLGRVDGRGRCKIQTKGRDSTSIGGDLLRVHEVYREANRAIKVAAFGGNVITYCMQTSRNLFTTMF